VDQGYRPADIEARHYARWEHAGYFSPRGSGEPYCIVIPPPNVTGTLHMGHAFEATIMDSLTRYHRMRGRRTLWQHGTDHAGIATQMVVERMLNSEGTDRLALGREKFLERVWAWKERSGNTISQQLRRLAASVDWSRERFTMDPGLSAAVIEVFVRLYDEGLIYRGKRLVNWDPVLHTALSDLEVLTSEEQGHLWRFRYPLSDGSGQVVVATTRPETMLGDTAVAVHPEDSRYRRLIGKTVDLPLTGRRIPIIADEYVDPEFGTGCVKITPAHDFNDYEVGHRHGLEQINVLDDDASLNSVVPAPYRGLDRFDARKRVVADLDALGLLDGIDDHVSMIPRGDRSGAIVEPYLTDQWYVRAAPLAAPAIEAVESKRIRFIPENWENWYFDWMRNIQDWCISRQLWWGHRIPAWYDHKGGIYVGRDEEEIRVKYGLDDHVVLEQDEDVLDTWFSSALWPFSTLGWPEQTRELSEFYPTSILVTGFDIIFFWVARMIMMGLKFMDDVPFEQVYIHGLIRDHEGQKMSKSKGNILDPIDIIDGVSLDVLLQKRTEGLMQPHLRAKIEQVTRKQFPDGIVGYGTDALRCTFASIATNARDLSFDLGRVEGYHRFCNKLWNATRYVLAQQTPTDEETDLEPGVADRWIRSRFRHAIDSVHEGFASHRIDLVAQSLYDFAWHEFCDWYVELSKQIINDADASTGAKAATRSTLVDVLGDLLKLLHPLMPYITEELWLALCSATGRHSDSIMIEPMATIDPHPLDADAEQEIAWLKAIVIGVRQVRGEMNIKPSQKVAVRIANASAQDRLRLAAHRTQLSRLAGIGELSTVDDTAAEGAATVLVGEMIVQIPLAGIVDIGAESARLGKQLFKVEKDIATTARKLENASFVNQAPESIVEKERRRLEDLEVQASQLAAQIDKLQALAERH
jgi:valyl-tRNA synthetase